MTTRTAAPALTADMIRRLAAERPDLADDCARALRGCKTTQNELAYVLGAYVPLLPAGEQKPFRFRPERGV